MSIGCCSKTPSKSDLELIANFHSFVQSCKIPFLQDKINAIRVCVFGKKIDTVQSYIILHNDIMEASQKICKLDQTTKQLWLTILGKLNKKSLYRVGFGTKPLNVSPAIFYVKKCEQVKLTFEMLNVKYNAKLDSIIQRIQEIDWDVFNTCFGQGFIHGFLTSKDGRCLIARIQTGNGSGPIVGWVWGTFLTIKRDSEKSRLNNDIKIFHVWAAAREANIAKLDFAGRLVEMGEKLIKNEHADFLTLRVDPKNRQIISKYQMLGFAKIHSHDNPSDDRICMVKALSNGELNKRAPTPNEIWQTMRAFTISTFGYFKLALYEIARQCTILWRKVFYC
jgi:ribosomal protein S18 acetylase RimI-like enzyme